MTFKMMKTSKLIEHPRNKEFFTDISESNPGFWEEFKGSIEQFGIIEPLIVDKETNYIRSGNQRYKAAVALDIEDVPVVMVDPEVDDEEVTAIEKENAKMIASNVYRRTIDPFAMFAYIGKLRKGASGKSVKTESPKIRQGDVAASTHKTRDFVSAADLYNTLPKEEQEELKVWFDEKADRKEGKLVAELRQMEMEAIKADERYDELVDTSRTAYERACTLDDMLDERNSKIAELTDVDFEGEIEDKDAEIRKLEGQKRKLAQKLKEAQERPDLHLYLKQCVDSQKRTNSVLKEIVQHNDLLSSDRLMDLIQTVQRTVEILKGAQNTNDENVKRIAE